MLTRRELPVFLFSLVYIVAFTLLSLRRHNYEFLMYSCVVIAAVIVMLLLDQFIRFSPGLLWGMSFWGLLHMAGGNVSVGGDRVLYELQLIPVVLRYDQFVHAYGFGMITLVCYRVLCDYLRPEVQRWWPLAILVLLMGSGMGALNEIIEFIAQKTMPETKVGGYDNTLWDLVFNLLGGIVAVTVLTLTRPRPCAPSAGYRS
jgi:hypothetical protein